MFHALFDNIKNRCKALLGLDIETKIKIPDSLIDELNNYDLGSTLVMLAVKNSSAMKVFWQRLFFAEKLCKRSIGGRIQIRSSFQTDKCATGFLRRPGLLDLC